MPRRRPRPDHGITIGVTIAGPRTPGSHVPLCLCGFAGGEHVERRDAAAEGRAHVEAAGAAVGGAPTAALGVALEAWQTGYWDGFKAARRQFGHLDVEQPIPYLPVEESS